MGWFISFQRIHAYGMQIYTFLKGKSAQMCCIILILLGVEEDKISICSWSGGRVWMMMPNEQMVEAQQIGDAILL